MHFGSRVFAGLIFVLLAISFSSCSLSGVTEKKEDIVFSVNDFQLTLQEFNDLLGEWGIQGAAKDRREMFVDVLVKRSVLLQEAQKWGLHKDPEFLSDLERFWSQSLVKIIIDRKLQRIKDGVFVPADKLEEAVKLWKTENPGTSMTEDEIKDLVEKEISGREANEQFGEWLDSLEKKADIKIDRSSLGIE